MICMLGENLLNLRKINGFSQEDVAEKIGVSRQAVAKWENGTTSPDIANCVALARLYNVTVDELLTFDSQENFARSLGASRKTLNRILNHGTDIDTLFRICELLEIRRISARWQRQF